MDTFKNLISKIPKEVSHVTQTLEKAGFEAYLVGGCVRDLIMSKEPKDWDITSNAKPEEIIGLFDKTVYENTFGTVLVVVSRETTPSLFLPLVKGEMPKAEGVIIEVTPYRIEAKYSDFRHPDEVKFSDNLEDDLKRRDFTVNAMALSSKGHLIDLFGGLKDIKDKMIKAVGNPNERFFEDSLRMLRAVRFACQLHFSVSHETTESILKNANLIKEISFERIRDEFEKIIMSLNPASGIFNVAKIWFIKKYNSRTRGGDRVEQSGEHIYDVWNHILHAVQHAADKNWSLEVRLAALFHDIGKPKARRAAELPVNLSGPRFSGSLSRPDHAKLSVSSAARKKYTFYGHEVVGARMGRGIMERLKFPKKEIELVEKLVRNHMFFSDTELITLSAVRRIITKVGVENIWLLMDVRESDRVGMKKKEAPYRLRKYFAMIEEALRDPISVGQLKIDGEFMMKELGIKPGPRMGSILNALLEEVLDAPEKNTVEHLSGLVKSLDMLGDDELKTLGERGKEKKEELEEKEIEKLHAKHGVRSGKGPDRKTGA